MDKCKHGFDHACLICGFTHIDGKKVWFDWAWQEQQKQIDELQARIQAATAKWISIASILAITESNVPDVIYKQLDELHDALCGFEPEQALKGGEV